MATFTDTFERANGGLGGNWVDVLNTPTIDGGWVKSNGSFAAIAYNTTISDGGRHQCTTRVTLAASIANAAGPVVKLNAAAGVACFAHVTYLGGVYGLRISRGSYASPSTLATTNLASAPPGIFLITLTWEEGVLTASIPNMGTVTGDAPEYAAGTYMGIRVVSTNQLADWVTMLTGAAQDFQVTPSAIPNYGTATALTFTGTNTEWGIGTPGTPTFTCDHGSLSSQEVTAAGSATAIYSPGNYLGPVVFTDPSSSLTDTCVVTSDIGVVPPTGAGDTWSPYKDLVDATGTLFEPDYLLTDKSPVFPSTPEVPGELTILPALQHIYIHTVGEWAGDPPTPSPVLTWLWFVINGAQQVTGEVPTMRRNTTLKQEAEDTNDTLAAIRTVNDRTLQDVIDYLQGDPLYTLASLHADIAAISTGSNQDVLDAIAGVRGSANRDLTQVVSLLDYLMTGNNYDLSDILTAISAVQTTANSTASAVSVISTAIENGFAAVLDAIAGIEPSTATAGAPIWPGLDNVTLGNVTALAGQVSIDAPMDGVLVHITAVDQGTLFYRYGDQLGYRKIGALTFVNDNGDCEVFQALNFEQAFYTPRTMQHATGVRIFTQHVASGTVQPWTVSV